MVVNFESSLVVGWGAGTLPTPQVLPSELLALALIPPPALMGC